MIPRSAPVLVNRHCVWCDLIGALLTLTFICLSPVAVAQDSDPTSHGNTLICAPDGIGVGGYDLVSYHQDGGPRAGREAYSAVYGEVTYLFEDAENREAFLADPERFLPVYRGFCASTLAMGRLACPDPTNFKLENGRLLLFELAGFTNGRTLWDSDASGFRLRADRNFERLVTAPAPTQ